MTRAAVLLVTLVVGLYLYRELTRDVLIIEPFNVPKEYADMGLTGEVIANHISDELDEIEKETIPTQMGVGLTVDKFMLSGDLPTFDVEVPGTKLGLKTLVEITREVFGIHPKSVRGDIVLSAEAAEAPVLISVRVSGASHVLRRLASPVNDPQRIPQLAAEAILHDVNPFLFALYKYSKDDLEAVAEVGHEMLGSSDHLEMARGHDLMGLAQSSRRRWKDAAEEYRQATELSPGLTYAYSNWGLMLQYLGRSDEAVAKYSKAVELSPSYSRAYVFWGYTLYKQGKPAEGSAKFQEAVRFDPKDPSPYVTWGLALAEAHKEDDAIAKYRQAINVAPKSAEAYSGWGDVLTSQEKWEEAAEEYRRAIEIKPNSADLYNSFGAMLYKQGKLDEAIDKFRLATQIEPKNTDAFNWWGLMLDKQGKLEKAIAEFRTAVQIDPESEDGYNNWGGALKKLGRDAEAEEKFAKARALSR